MSSPVHPCPSCIYGIHDKSSYTSNPLKQRLDILGAYIHGDVFGKITILSLNGSIYYILYKDDCTEYNFIHFAKTKNAAFPFFKKITKIIKHDIGNKVVRLMTDRGSEFCNIKFTTYLDDHGIHHQTSTIYILAQNGFIEWDNRVIIESAKSIMYANLLKLYQRYCRPKRLQQLSMCSTKL